MLIRRLDPCAVSKTTSSMGQKLDLQQLNLRGGANWKCQLWTQRVVFKAIIYLPPKVFFDHH